MRLTADTDAWPGGETWRPGQLPALSTCTPQPSGRNTLTNPAAVVGLVVHLLCTISIELLAWLGLHTIGRVIERRARSIRLGRDPRFAQRSRRTASQERRRHSRDWARTRAGSRPRTSTADGLVSNAIVSVDRRETGAKETLASLSYHSSLSGGEAGPALRNRWCPAQARDNRQIARRDSASR